MGVDAYIEKPMCLTIEEGKRDGRRRPNRTTCVTQIGTQQRSIPLNNFACDLIQSGAIGKVKVVLAPNFIGSDPWVDKPAQPMPQGRPGRMVGRLDQRGAVRPYHTRHPSRLESMGRLRRGWPLLWRLRLGYPLLRSSATCHRDQRHGPRRNPARRTGQDHGDREIRGTRDR